MRKQGLRKLLAVLVVLTMMTSFMLPAMAAYEEAVPSDADNFETVVPLGSYPECACGDRYRFNKFNANGYPPSGGFNWSLYNGGTIRLWFQVFAFGAFPAHVGGYGYRYANEPNIARVVSAEINTGECAMALGLIRMVTPTQVSVAFGATFPDGSAGGPPATFSTGLRRAAFGDNGLRGFAWETMVLDIELICGHVTTVELTNHFNPCDCGFACQGADGCPDCLWPPCEICGCDVCEYLCDPCPECGDACLTCDPCDCGRITFRFPGLQDMIIQYWTGAWQTLANGPFDDAVVFSASGATTVRAVRDGLVYSRDITANGTYVIDAPVIQLYVRGVPVGGNTLGVVGGGSGSNWVDNGVAAYVYPDYTVFTVFNNRTYDVVLNRAGFFPLSRTSSEGYDDGYAYLYVDLSAYMAYITVPAGVSNVRMQSNGWIINPAQAGDVIWLLVDYPNYRAATVRFDFCCLVQHEVPFVLNGDNPLIIACDCCDENPGFPCNLCSDCGECLDCGECPEFGFAIFSNGPEGSPSANNPTFTAEGRIRLWTQFDGTGVRLPIEVRDTMTATIRGSNECALDLLLFNTPVWVAGVGNTPTFNFFDVFKTQDWQFIDITITVCDYVHTFVLHNGSFCVCDECLDCGECGICSECLDFSVAIFNNGPGGSSSTANSDLAAAGTIRIWPQFDGTSTLMPLAVADTIVALDQDGDNAIGFVTVNRQWVDGTGWTNSFVNIDVNKNAPWQTITLTITVCGEDYEILLVNSRYFSLHIFNNGPGGTQYPRPNESLQNAGLIRMWTRLMNVGADVPYTAMTALDQDGNDAMDFITVNYVGGLVRSIDARKYMPWETITFSMTVYGQTVTVLLVNDLFPGWFGLNIFNNGPEGSPSTPNVSLANAGTIRMWTQFDGVNAPIPRSATSTMVATIRDTGACALHLILLRPITGDAITMIDVDKNAHWEFIDFSIVVFNQRVDVVLHNPDDNGGGEPCECDVCDICDGCLDENCDCDECTPCDCPVVGTCDCDLCDVCDGCLDENCD
ncbi:MAG: hypothetical protein FWC75_04955, partial [Oscillospiraceae bacterium]|nr:hypothetical protein [Oscillospiraceae bacterium]